MGDERELEDVLRRYLRTHRSLREPELLLPGRSRQEAIQAIRRAVQALGDTDRDAVTPEEEQSGDRRRQHGERDRSRQQGERDDGLPPEPPPIEGGPALAEEELDRLSREATEEELLEISDLPTLERVANACVRCPLHEGREKVVFGEGSPRARVVCVGEAPGATEDRTGRPFVGPAGQLLDRLLLSAGFRREEVFICNVLKCRPPGNRNPKTEEIEQCSPYLHRQLQLLDPEVIVAFGTFASQTLLDARESLGRLRKQTHLYRGWPLVVTYHPAALLRNPKWTVPSWKDLQKVRRLLEDDDPSLRPADSERMQVEVFGSDE